MKKLLLLFLLMFLWAQGAWATTVTFQNGVSSYTGELDAKIFSGSTNEELTSDPLDFSTITGNSVIIYFDVSSIPSTATVSSASLTVYLNELNCTSTTVSLTPIYNPDNSGAFTTYATATDGFNNNATWNYKNNTINKKWSVAGSNANFTDVNGLSAVSTVSSGACPGFTAKTFTGLSTMVQGWVTSSASNGGMFLVGASSHVQMYGQFNATASNHAQLSVTYTAAPSAAVTTISNAKISNANIY